MSAISRVASHRSGRSRNRARISAGGFNQPSALRRVTFVVCERHQAPHALEHVGHERVAGLEVAHRVRRDGARPRRARRGAASPGSRRRTRARAGARRRRRAGRAERLAERIEQPRGVVDAALGRGATRVRPGPGDRDEPGGVRADLHRVDPRVAALAEHVRVGEQPAEVRVAGVVGREQHDVRVVSRAPRLRRSPPWRARAHRDRGAEDRAARPRPRTPARTARRRRARRGRSSPRPASGCALPRGRPAAPA